MDDIRLGLSLRMVVVGKGAISKTIGAGTRHTESSTGTNMLTLASTDQTFSFVIGASFRVVGKVTPAKTLRMVRILNAAGDAMSRF
jgi:hypothetical protein